MKAVEKYYTTAEAALLLSIHPKTVVDRLLSHQFGEEVVDLADPAPVGKVQQHDYRIPASGLNAYIAQRRVFLDSAEIGIVARTEGELRRKAERKAA